MANVAFNIPLFPLGVFLLPGEQTGLHIFEPRYRQLIPELEEAMTEGREDDNRFGIRASDQYRWRCNLARQQQSLPPQNL